ncbi:hypothetical protein [Pyxidicoccus caerfyrddinensis]|uniref:hypothetical protein n=1 Tax=Pyxidicoccus caerfyrddinensis TaxID=2709663 RepID=UPI0013DA38B9|nr:hypothetical protein [Pyxidicoccus caerfyrddinensis]
MKFQCEACERLVPLEVFRVEAGVLVVKCDRCGAETRARASTASSFAMGGSSLVGEGQGAPPPPEPSQGMSAPLPPRASTPSLRVLRGRTADVPLTGETLFEAPPGACPKCVAPRREDAESCAQCGLVYVNFTPDEHRPSEVLAEAWQSLAAEHWDDWEAHDRLMTLAMGRGELAMLGRLYRLRLARAPDDVMAQRGRDELVRRATLVVPATAEVSSGPSDIQKRMKTLGMGVLFLVVLVLAVLVFQNLRALMAEG